MLGSPTEDVGEESADDKVLYGFMGLREDDVEK
jgi:hypothetical protein